MLSIKLWLDAVNIARNIYSPVLLFVSFSYRVWS